MNYRPILPVYRMVKFPTSGPGAVPSMYCNKPVKRKLSVPNILHFVLNDILHEKVGVELLSDPETRPGKELS
jgi:hypothetical protein